jgi:hypothetical protein
MARLKPDAEALKNAAAGNVKHTIIDMTLQKLLEQTTPLPWIPDWERIRDNQCNSVCCSPDMHDDKQWLADRELITHSVNLFPKLVEALEEIERLTATYSESTLSFGVVNKKAAALIKEANNIPTS